MAVKESQRDPAGQSAHSSPLCLRRDKFIQHGGIVATILALQRLSEDRRHERACRHLVEGILVALAPEGSTDLISSARLHP